MNITQTFYDNLASQYDKLFLDWLAATHEQAAILNKILEAQGVSRAAQILDCACGIGTQAIGLARLGYRVTASDISEGELAEAKVRAEQAGVEIPFYRADFRALSKTFSATFDVVMAMDNALPHMLSHEDLGKAIASITGQLKEKGIFIGSIRDYDALLTDKPSYSPPYIHKTDKGRRICFQTWEWHDDHYKFVQYIIEDEDELRTNKFECEYRATRREELTNLFMQSGCRSVHWLFPEETGFYQPIVVARK